MDNQLFYMIYVERENGPTYKHYTKAEVIVEAKRLAKTLKKKVYILLAVKTVELNEFLIKDIENDGLPF